MKFQTKRTFFFDCGAIIFPLHWKNFLTALAEKVHKSCNLLLCTTNLYLTKQKVIPFTSTIYAEITLH